MAVEVAVAVAVEVDVGVVVVCSSVVVGGWVLSTVVVGLLVRSVVSARGLDAPAGGPVRPSTKAESNVERVMAATIAPTSTTEPINIDRSPNTSMPKPVLCTWVKSWPGFPPQ